MASLSRDSIRSERYVIKLGGALDADITRAATDIQTLVKSGAEVVVVHGGGAAADRLATALGNPPTYLTAKDGRRSRYTDAAALDSLLLGMCGRVKPTIVAALAGMGIHAVGLSGMDGGMIRATRNPPARARVDGVDVIVRDDLSGRVSSVDTTLPRMLTSRRFVPVISPPALGPEGPLNVDADRLAAAMAIALQATWLIILTNVPGLLRNRHDPTTLIPVAPPGYEQLAEGRMKVKLQAAADAHRNGVPHVVLADGRVDSPVLSARAGGGTTFEERSHVQAS